MESDPYHRIRVRILSLVEISHTARRQSPQYSRLMKLVIISSKLNTFQTVLKRAPTLRVFL